jgi:hypothetical protein
MLPRPKSGLVHSNFAFSVQIKMKARKLQKKGKSKGRKWIKEKSIALSQQLPVMQLIVLLQ